MNDTAEQVLDALREATRGTDYEDRLYLVGGFVRDKAMGLPSDKDDIDLVLEGDALALARFLHERGVAQHHPVVYPRFGTAMVVVLGRDVELVTARIESYAADSRKPDSVQPGTIAEDALRRDFTINTLLERLHTGEVIDPTGRAFDDLRDRIIRTPAEPHLTFTDDPLRMMRAVRFAARFGYEIEPTTWTAVQDAAPRLAIISRERIRDEFCKALMTSRPTLGLELFRTSGLLKEFIPELLEMVGVTQNEFHAYPVWEHTMHAVGSLPPDASLILRLSVLFHDIGKPRTRTEDEAGRIHFYGHQDVGAQMAREIMGRLKFSNDDIAAVTRLVGEHMRIGEYKNDWTDSAVRRLIRDLGPNLAELFAIHRADVSALSDEHQDISRAVQLRERIAEIEAREDISKLTSPLDGRALMKLFSRPSGPWLGVIKDYLTNEVIEGRLAPDDTDRAAELARRQYQERYGETTEA